MILIERPVNNIKNLKNLREVDIGALAFVSFFTIAFLSLIFGVSAVMGAIESLRFFFSFDFFEVQSVETLTAVQTSPLHTNFDEVSTNNVYRLLNISKVSLWVVTLLFLLYFLFKKPVNEKE